MATNKRDLRAYIRYDGNQRIIPGSLVLRRSKPKVGNWKEIQTYECCDGGGGGLSNKIMTANVVIRTPAIAFNVELNAIGCSRNSNTDGSFDEIASDYNKIVEFLNTNYSYYGLFKYIAPDTITLQLSNEMVNSCSNDYLDLNINIVD